nr:laccase 10 [Cyathus bulleri]
MRLLQAATITLELEMGAYASIGPAATLNIINKDIAPDGYTRSTVLAGGIFPGPVISGTKGSNFRINVVNQLTDITVHKTTSIHWHGVYQKGTNWADGPALVTQCPIASGNSFLYDSNVPDQAGTYWYHSHLKTQYCDGLRGAFVVYDPNDPHKVSMTWITTIPLSLSPTGKYHVYLILLLNTLGSTLVNGLGRYPLEPKSPPAVVNVVKGKIYRLRLISISCNPNFAFSTDDHELIVIEVDGVNVHSVVVDSLRIFAGQRYSVILNANQDVKNYWIRANPSPLGPQGFLGGLNSAVLCYAGAPEEDRSTALPDLFPNMLKETGLHPLSNEPAPGKPHINGADVSYNLAIDFNPLTFKFKVNGATYDPPTVPVLLQILSEAVNPSDLMPANSIHPLPKNKVIQPSIPAGVTSSVVGAPHSFHLHGHHFHATHSAGSFDYNYENPVIRDVVSTGVIGDNLTIRYRTDNSGL